MFLLQVLLLCCSCLCFFTLLPLQMLRIHKINIILYGRCQNGRRRRCSHICGTLSAVLSSPAQATTRMDGPIQMCLSWPSTTRYCVCVCVCVCARMCCGGGDTAGCNPYGRGRGYADVITRGISLFISPQAQLGQDACCCCCCCCYCVM